MTYYPLVHGLRHQNLYANNNFHQLYMIKTPGSYTTCRLYHANRISHEPAS